MGALEDRRQNARDALADMYGGVIPAAEEAIEVATQIRLTPEILNAAKPTVPWLTEEQRLRAAFEAAGFEVVE